jgi:para-nitrobenzyl esterase
MTETPIVRIGSGSLSGASSADGKVHAFKGIPYARPPLGALRWRPPQPAESWSGIRSAVRFGPRCIQRERPQNSVSYFGPEEQSEDCLYLNVWTSAPESGAKKPVMVWFHGGGFEVGSGALPIFDGEALARRGVVVVTINYRLGGFGFFAHPELTRESSTGSSGNWGLLDEIAALRWVQENIEAFGGDPGLVTIFGQSVGSACVNCLMTSPPARGLFHRAIGESGGSMAPLGRPGSGSLLLLADAEKIGLRIADAFGRRSIEELRALPAQEIQLSWPKNAASRPFIIVDGTVLPEGVYDAFAAGRQNDVPLLTGANSEEGSSRTPMPSIEAWTRTLQDEFGEDGRRLFEAYGGGEDYGWMSRLSACHKSFNWVNWTWARMQAQTGREKVFFYHFSHAPPPPPGRSFVEENRGRLGAFHTAEIPYVFGTLGKRDWVWTEADFDLSETMSSYWVNFATHGDPNGAGLPGWPVFDPQKPTIMRFDDAVAPGNLPDREIFDLWDDIMQRLRARGRPSAVAAQ